MSESVLSRGQIRPARVRELRGASAITRRAMLVAALCWSVSAGSGSLAAQSAPSQRPPGAAELSRDSVQGDGSVSALDAQREIEKLAPLSEALHDVHGLTKPQSDSLAVLEERYARVFESLAISARHMIDSASSEGSAPDVAELRSLCLTAWHVRGAELVSARAMLTTRAQRKRFDVNVSKIHDEESERVQELLERSSGVREGGTRT
jgi:hypothetical protein